MSDFYRKYDAQKLKEEFENILGMLIFVVNINFESAAADRFFYDVSASGGAPIYGKNIAVRAYEQIAREPDKRRSLLVKALRTVLDQYRVAFAQEMKKSIPDGVVCYFSILLRKLLLEGKRIEKNDFLDSQLMLFYPQGLIITTDGAFIGIIKEVDAAYCAQIENVLAQIRT